MPSFLVRTLSPNVQRGSLSSHGVPLQWEIFPGFFKFPIFQGFSPISLIFSRNSLIFPGFCWVSQFSLSFSWFQWFSQDFVDFVDYSRIPFIFPGFNWFFQDFIDFSRILLICPGFHWLFQDFIEFLGFQR